MSAKRPSSRDQLIHYLYEFHLDISDVVLLPKSSTDGEKGCGELISNHDAPTKAHSGVFSFFSAILKAKLKGMNKSSEGLYIVYVDFDVSVEGIKAFVDCLYGKSIDKSMDQSIISDALKMASFYQVPMFIFEELLSSKTIYLCLKESLKREKEESENLLESCKEMLQTNCAIYQDTFLLQDLDVNLFNWISALEELPIPNYLPIYLIDFAIAANQNSVEILTQARSNAVNCNNRVAHILKVEKFGNFQPSEHFSVRYKNESVENVLQRASSYSSVKFLPQNARLLVEKNPEDDRNEAIERTTLLADLEIKPGDSIFIEVQKEIKIRTIDGEENKVLIDFHAKRVRDLKVQISDLLGTAAINLICLFKNGEILGDMKSLEEVFEGVEEKVFSASIRGDPIDPNKIVIGYGEDNVAAWRGVVITANEEGCEALPVNWSIPVLGGTSWLNIGAPSSGEHWWQCQFKFPIVIGSFAFDGTWRGRGDESYHLTDFKIEGSIDEKDWTLVLSKKGIQAWPPLQIKQFTCQNVRAFKIYRITSFNSTDHNSFEARNYLTIKQSIKQSNMFITESLF